MSSSLNDDYGNMMRRNYGLAPICATSAGPFKVSKECISGTPTRVLLWGDSYAMMWGQALADVMPIGIIQATRPKCIPMVGVFPSSRNATKDRRQYDIGCLDFNTAVFDYAMSNPEIETIVWSSPFASPVAGNAVYIDKNGEVGVVSAEKSVHHFIKAAEVLRSAD